MSPKIRPSATWLVRMGSTYYCSERGLVTVPYQTGDYYIVNSRNEIVDYVPGKNKRGKK